LADEEKERRKSEDFLSRSGDRWRGRRCFQVLFTRVDEVSRSPTYLAASNRITMPAALISPIDRAELVSNA
jgi:hypothetical protein